MGTEDETAWVYGWFDGRGLAKFNLTVQTPESAQIRKMRLHGSGLRNWEHEGGDME